MIMIFYMILTNCHTMKIDFDAILKALKQVVYAGELALKVDQYLKTHYPEDVFAGLKNMAAAARKMAAVLE